MRRDCIYTREEIYNRYSRYDSSQITYPDWYNELCDITKIKLIETQRLYNTEIGINKRISRLEKRVLSNSKELASLLQQTIALSSEIATRLDNTFPSRLLASLKYKKAKKEHLLDTHANTFKELYKLSGIRKSLSEVGLIEQEEDPIYQNIKNIDENILAVLKLYIEDSKEKLNAFQEIAKKLSLLKDIINKRFKHKLFFINKESGFVFKSTSTDLNIPLDRLSSGEQNELILFYDLLFNCSSKHLILIDEPEISLHISWQQSLIEDLTEISNHNNCSLLIATHSPDIIGSNWGLVQALSGKE